MADPSLIARSRIQQLHRASHQKLSDAAGLTPSSGPRVTASGEVTLPASADQDTPHCGFAGFVGTMRSSGLAPTELVF